MDFIYGVSQKNFGFILEASTDSDETTLPGTLFFKVMLSYAIEGSRLQNSL
jgi:hypothetical protein